MEDGLVGFITGAFDPKVIYENFAYLAGLASFMPWLLVLFFMVRFLRESSDALVGKAQLVDMILSMNKMVVFFAVYSVAGILLFSLVLALTHLFERFGSMSIIFDQLTTLKSNLFTDDGAVKSFFQNVVEYAVDIVNLPNAAITFLIFKITSTSFLIVSQMLKVLYACGLALIYAWGFIAITTMMLKDDLNLIKGWKINIATLFVWPIVEAIFLGIWSLVVYSASAYIEMYYSNSGFGAASITMYYLFSTAVLGGSMLIKIISPFIAVKLVSNESFGGTLGAGPAMVGAFAMQRVMQVATGAANPMGKSDPDNGKFGMAPNAQGTRKRDGVLRAFSDTGNKSVGDVVRSVGNVAKSVKNGMGNITNSGDNK